MKRLFLKLFILAFILFNSFLGLTQKQKSNFEIQVYGIPYYKLSNSIYANKMTLKSDYFRLNYSERVNQEIGLNFKYRLTNWKFGLGLSYNNFNYDHSVYFVDFRNYSINDLTYRINNELNLKTLGISLIGERKLSKTINLGFRLSFNGIIQNEIKNNPVEFLSSNEQFKIKEEHTVLGSTKTLVIPEFFISKNIGKGVDLIAGYKLKFYNKFYEPGNEFYSLSIKENQKEIFNYTIDTYQAGFFFGASYTFKLPKLRKPREE